jgi:hypothetical protein
MGYKKLPVTSFQLWLVLRLAGWLCVLPMRLRLYPLPQLLRGLRPGPRRQGRDRPTEMANLVRLVIWLCQCRPFRTRLFPRTCLRQALGLYYVLTRLGYSATFNIGVCKQKGILHAHSWVTVQGWAVGEAAPLGIFQIIYSYPPHVVL